MCDSQIAETTDASCDHISYSWSVGKCCSTRYLPRLCQPSRQPIRNRGPAGGNCWGIIMQPQVHKGSKQVTSVHHSNPARPSVRQSWRSGHAALPRHSLRVSLRYLHPSGVRFRGHPIIALRLRGIERQRCRRQCATTVVSAASSAVGSPTTVQGVNLRALGKLTVKLGFWHAEDHPILQRIVEESKRRQIYDEQLKCCNESRLKTVVESLGMDEMGVGMRLLRNAKHSKLQVLCYSSARANEVYLFIVLLKIVYQLDWCIARGRRW